MMSSTARDAVFCKSRVRCVQLGAALFLFAVALVLVSAHLVYPHDRRFWPADSLTVSPVEAPAHTNSPDGLRFSCEDWAVRTSTRVLVMSFQTRLSLHETVRITRAWRVGSLARALSRAVGQPEPLPGPRLQQVCLCGDLPRRPCTVRDRDAASDLGRAHRRLHAMHTAGVVWDLAQGRVRRGQQVARTRHGQ